MDDVVGLIVLNLLGGFVAWGARHSTRPDVDPQRAPGVRLPSTMRSRAAWLAAHRRVAGSMWWAGVTTSTAATALLVWRATGQRDPAHVEVATLAVTAVLVVWLVALCKLGHDAARDVPDDAVE